MMEMEAKGITWVENICNKFENMCLEMEDTLDASYIESQMRIVSESVTRFYSDVMKELLPPSAHDSDETTVAELPIDQDADVGFCKKKSSQDFKQITVKANTKLATQDSSINHDIDNVAIYAESCDTDADSDENQQSKKMSESMTAAEILTLLKTNTFSTSQSCEISNSKQNHEATHSKPSSAEVTTLASVTDCCNEIENASVEQTSSFVKFVKSSEEEVMKMVSSSSVVFEDLSGDNKTMQQELEETCVMVTRDELQLVAKERTNMKTGKKKKWQPFSLSKKSARKQEYEELALCHGNNENGNGDYVEISCPTLLEDQKKPLLPELEWELL